MPDLSSPLSMWILKCSLHFSIGDFTNVNVKTLGVVTARVCHVPSGSFKYSEKKVLHLVFIGCEQLPTKGRQDTSFLSCLHLKHYYNYYFLLYNYASKQDLAGQD